MVPPRLPLAIETRRVRSFDGTDLAYHVTPAPSATAPWIVLANGLGGTTQAWRGLLDYLSPRYRFLAWDYRGLHASGRPTPDTAAAYAIPNQARDLEAILAAEGIGRASLLGWGMGVPVVLEALRRLSGVAANVVLLNGASGRLLDTRRALFGGKALLARLGDLARAARSSGLALRPLFQSLRALVQHDASAGLGKIAVPALVITGDHDLFTPLARVQQMARAIPAAEILVVRGGAHQALVEYPELVSLRVERFYREHGY